MSMNKRFLLGGAIAIFLFWKSAPITNYPPKGDTIIVFGDSLVSGVGATPGKDFVSRVELSLGRSILNLGVPGDTTGKALSRIGEALEQNPDIVLILLGGNDFLQKIPKSETERNLISIIQKFQSVGAVTVVLGVRGGLLSDSNDDMYKRVAKQTGSMLIPDVLDGLFGDKRYMSDAVHPNDAGYEHIAARVLPTVIKILPK